MITYPIRSELPIDLCLILLADYMAVMLLFKERMKSCDICYGIEDKCSFYKFLLRIQIEREMFIKHNE